MQVYTYSRFSTDRQDETTIGDQQRAAHEFATRRGWPIAGDFSDQGISGAAMGNRPALLQVLELLKPGDVLLTLDLTRLCRSQDLAPLVERLRFRQVRVFGVMDNFDSDSPHARMQAGLSGLMSDELRASIRARTHLALETRAKNTKPTGGRSYGYDAAGNPVEPEASIAREIFRRYAEGESMKQIASDLNVRRMPSPGSTWNRTKRRTDGRWLISALHALLHNERYIGRVIWNRSAWVKNPDTGKRQQRERPQSEWVINEGPALVDMPTWQQAQARLNERAGAYSGGSGGQPRYLLSGLLQCRACGSRLIVTGNRGSHYYCGTHRQGGHAACPMEVGVRREVAEDCIMEPIRTDIFAPEAVEHAVTFIRMLARQQRTIAVSDATPELVEIDAEIADLEALITARPARAATLAASLEALRQRRTQIQRQGWRYAATLRTDEPVPAERAYRDHVHRLSEIFNGPHVAPARAMLRQITGDIPVYPDDTGRRLVAKVGLDLLPLWRAAGIGGPAANGGFASNGSGGPLWTEAKEILLARHPLNPGPIRGRASYI